MTEMRLVMLYVPFSVSDGKSASVLPPPWTECSRAASRSCLEPIPISCVPQKPDGVIAGGKGLAAEVLWDKGKVAQPGRKPEVHVPRGEKTLPGLMSRAQGSGRTSEGIVCVGRPHSVSGFAVPS